MKMILPILFGEKEKEKLVIDSEKHFERQLEHLTGELFKDDRLEIISLSGPSCAGKTTTAKKIIDEAEKIGRRIIPISIDDFYKNRKEYEKKCMENGEEMDFEKAESIDLLYFRECFDGIFNNRTVLLPQFDFATGMRIKCTPYTRQKNHILMFEGIQANYPQIRSLFQNCVTQFVFIDAAESLETPYGVFSGKDLRLARRLVRDFYRRNSSPDQTFSMWTRVTSNEERSIYPYTDIINHKISSTMAYEPMIMKKHLFEILGSIKSNEMCYEKAQQFLSRYTFFPEISEKYLPKESVYHEFL